MTGVRERLNRNPQLTVSVIAALTVLALAFTVYQVLASRRKLPNRSPDSFFTVDDGKTFFTASSDNIPPFDYNGKQAVHAYVFECQGKRFVGYLERYKPDAHKAILAGNRTPEVERFGREIKKPGSPTWTATGDLAAEAPITGDIQVPHGLTGAPEPVEP